MLNRRKKTQFHLFRKFHSRGSSLPFEPNPQLNQLFPSAQYPPMSGTNVACCLFPSGLSKGLPGLTCHLSGRRRRVDLQQYCATTVSSSQPETPTLHQRYQPCHEPSVLTCSQHCEFVPEHSYSKPRSLSNFALFIVPTVIAGGQCCSSSAAQMFPGGRSYFLCQYHPAFPRPPSGLGPLGPQPLLTPIHPFNVREPASASTSLPFNVHEPPIQILSSSPFVFIAAKQKSPSPLKTTMFFNPTDVTRLTIRCSHHSSRTHSVPLTWPLSPCSSP